MRALTAVLLTTCRTCNEYSRRFEAPRSVAGTTSYDLSPADNLHAILGVPPQATSNEIKVAFRRRARKLHPDLNDAPDAERAFRRLVSAHEILSNPRIRMDWEAMQRGRQTWRRESSSATSREYRSHETSRSPQSKTSWVAWAPALSYIFYMYIACVRRTPTLFLAHSPCAVPTHSRILIPVQSRLLQMGLSSWALELAAALRSTQASFGLMPYSVARANPNAARAGVSAVDRSGQTTGSTFIGGSLA